MTSSEVIIYKYILDIKSIYYTIKSSMSNKFYKIPNRFLLTILQDVLFGRKEPQISARRRLLLATYSIICCTV